MGRDEPATLEGLQRRDDGTWQDLVTGEVFDTREQALASLRKYRRLPQTLQPVVNRFRAHRQLERFLGGRI